MSKKIIVILVLLSIMLLKNLNGQSCTVTSATPNYGSFPAIGGHIASTLVLNPTGCTPVFNYYPTWVGIVYSGGVMHIYCSQNTGNQRSGYVVCNGSTIFYIQQAAAVFAPGTISGATTACYNQSPGTLSGTICSGVCYDRFFQWEKSTTGPQTGFVSITGATEQNYTPGPLTTTTYFRRHDQCDSQSGYTNVLTVTVPGSAPTSGSYGYDQWICMNTAPDTITQISAPTGGFGTYSYQWMASTDDQTSWSDIAGATQKDYSPGTLSGRTYFKVKVISGSCTPVYSESVFIDINPLADGGIIMGDQSVVLNREALDILNVRAYPYTGTVSFEWEYSEDSTIWQSDASLGTSISCAPGILSTTTYFRRKMTDQCGVSYSNTVTKTILPTISGGVSDRGLSVNENYVYTLEPNAEVKDRSELYYLPLDSIKHSVGYYDGLGQMVQQISITGTPDYCDVIGSNEYDALGREIVKRLPYPTISYNYGEFDDSAQYFQELYYLSRFDDNLGLSKSIIEESPLNRILTQGSPGSAWQPSAHPIRFSYGANKEEDVKDFHVGSNNSLILSGWQEPGVLYKTTIMDENWSSGLLHTSEEYKDYHGNVVLKRNYVLNSISNIDTVETYYVYDDFNLLRYVLSPEAINNLDTLTSFTSASSLVKEWCYYYEYDGKRRMIIKQLPGAEPVFMAYDPRDRLVVTQDGNMRQNKEWLFTKYDHFNRPVLTGLLATETTYTVEQMQGLIDEAFSNSARELYVSRDNSYPLDLGYIPSSFPDSTDGDITYYTATYYDDYEYLDNKAYESSYAIGATSPLEEARGLITGIKALVLDGGSTYLTTTTYYDEKYRPIQILRDLYDLTDTIEIISNSYDFIGQLLETKTSHISSTNATEVIKYYSYDHMGRLLRIRQEANDTTVVLSEMGYNDLGQLGEKKLHVSGSTALQTINYEYNIRGWLTAINDPTDLGNDLFGMDLCYNDPTLVNGLTTLSQYNGNISGIRWKSEGDSYIKGYGYSYDGLNRLTSADYGEGSSFATNRGWFNESIGSYDLMGNIISLTRIDIDSLIIDELEYNYTGNQLNKIDDSADKTKGFIDITNAADYEYDFNGNLTKDLNKGISDIKYNYLNLPSEVIKDAEHKVMYIYDATGVKLKKQVISGTSTPDRYYAGAFEYDDNRELNLIHNEEGVVNVTSSTYDYEYFLKDHLGNTRVTFKPDGTSSETLQKVSYYPFGMTASINNYGLNNKYLYNGKELQDELELDWYDYGARFYDAQIGRFTTQDAFAEKYIDFSPYQYATNNPVVFIDIRGDSAWSVTRTWNESDIEGFANYAGNKLQEYSKDGTKLDCADLAFTLIIGYANENGLSLSLTDSEGNTTFDSNSDAFNNAEEFTTAVKGSLTAKDIPANTFSVDKSNKQVGDMIILTAPVDHIAIFSSINPGKLTYGNLNSDNTATELKTTGDWSNASHDARNRAISYSPDKKHVNRWDALSIRINPIKITEPATLRVVQ